MNNLLVLDNLTDDDESVDNRIITLQHQNNDEGGRETKKLYVTNNQDKRLLVVLCIGIKNNESGGSILDPTSEAWAMQPVDVRKPLRVEHYIAEVKRRSELFDVQPRPKPAQWNMDKLTAWLSERPIENPACVEFLTAEATRVTRIFEEALRVKKAEKTGSPAGLWVRNEPWLRLLHCILEDNIRPLYLQRDRVATRPMLDAFTSPDRPISVYKRIALRWNDPLFNPITTVSYCHEDFGQQIDIGWDAVVGEGGFAVPTEENVHHRLTDWERSGQGEGTHQEADSDDEFIQNRDASDLTDAQLGRLENRSAYAMHSCKNVLEHPSQGKVGSWILYYWEQMDRFNLLECTVNILSNDVNAPDAQSVPILNVEPSNNKRRRVHSPFVNAASSVDEDSAIRQVGEGLVQCVVESKRATKYSTHAARRSDLEKKIYDLTRVIRESQMAQLRCEGEEKALLKSFMEEDKCVLKANQDELKDVVAVLARMDSENSENY